MSRTAQLASLFSSIIEQGRVFSVHREDLPIIEQCRMLMSAHGEAPTLRLARSILATYAELDEDARLEFFEYLADELDLDRASVVERAQDYETDPTVANLRALLAASEPQRQILFRKLNQAEGATAQLVALRADLLTAIALRPELGKIDIDLVHLFTSWFNRGFLVLQRIDWSSPAHILEKIIAYEAVHEINDWEDLRRRTEPSDRRCYAYVHPQMPDDPLIFVEVALTRGIPSSIGEVLAERPDALDADVADTAVFYSISNCQPGLFAITLGDSLIKHVVADLTADLPHLREFVTLSPMPGLANWLKQEGRIEAERLQQFSDMAIDRDPSAATDQELRALAAAYVAREKRTDGQPADSVARFHLSNGAVIHNVLSGANLSDSGIAQSFGAMVNYRYDLRNVERNSEAYAADRSVKTTRAVQTLSRQGRSLLSGGK